MDSDFDVPYSGIKPDTAITMAFSSNTRLGHKEDGRPFILAKASPSTLTASSTTAFNLTVENNPPVEANGSHNAYPVCH
ncbi:hypothetical protein PG997_010485 [Apiospora hydei]|uniref:Uncharacterized protein n=1 Tax=Apiospora hydei TaxID=1337664 RepID=A0ABR1VXA4_9PEZI